MTCDHFYAYNNTVSYNSRSYNLETHDLAWSTISCVNKYFFVDLAQLYTHINCTNIKYAQLLSSFSADCLTEFVKTIHAHAMLGTLKPTVHTVDDCKEACIKKDGCAGFDFNNTNNACWLHTSATVQQLYPSDPVDNYKRTDSCKMKLGMYWWNVLQYTFLGCYACVGMIYPEKQSRLWH